MKNLKEKLINENENLENKAYDAVFDYVDNEAKDFSEFLIFIMNIINEATGANMCRGNKTKNAGYLEITAKRKNLLILVNTKIMYNYEKS